MLQLLVSSSYSMCNFDNSFITNKCLDSLLARYLFESSKRLLVDCDFASLMHFPSFSFFVVVVFDCLQWPKPDGGKARLWICCVVATFKFALLLHFSMDCCISKNNFIRGTTVYQVYRHASAFEAAVYHIKTINIMQYYQNQLWNIIGICCHTSNIDMTVATLNNL